MVQKLTFTRLVNSGLLNKGYCTANALLDGNNDSAYSNLSINFCT